jgi:hypothetical protein
MRITKERLSFVLKNEIQARDRLNLKLRVSHQSSKLFVLAYVLFLSTLKRTYTSSSKHLDALSSWADLLHLRGHLRDV